MDATLDQLPEEGQTETVTRTRRRRECEVCGEPAHYKLTFLLEGDRNNRASSAYGRDDCTYCEDAIRFVCAIHEADRTLKQWEGYGWCSTFPCSERFKHMFLYWEAQP